MDKIFHSQFAIAIKMKNALLIFFLFVFPFALSGQTQKDTVTVLQDSEISTGTWADSLRLYFQQGGAWKKGTISGLITFLEGVGIRAEGKVTQVAVVSDTTGITGPYEGDLAVTSGGDTLLLFDDSEGWIMFVGGGGGGGGMTSFTAAGTSGTPQTVSNGQTLTIAAGAGLTTTAGATRTVTVASDTASVLASKTWADGRFLQSEVDGSITNEIQTLSLTDSTNRNYTLSLSSGGTVAFNASDPDTLSFASPNLSISGGNSVDLSGILSGYVSGSGSANRVAYWSGTSTLGSSANWTFDGTTVIRTGTVTATSGTTNLNQFNATFSPTSGTGVFNGITLSNTINQTGGANGITRALYINPTLTAAAAYRAIETTNGSGYSIYT